MKIRLNDLKQSYALWATISLFAAALTTITWTLVFTGIGLSDRPHALTILAGGLTLLTLFALRKQIRLHRQHTRKVLFLLDAIANHDYTVHFTEIDVPDNDRLINQALNRMTQILHQIATDTAQREKYYELILECVNTGIVVLNSKGAVYQKNSEALRLLGMEIFTHVKQIRNIDVHLMELLESCRPGDKLQAAFTNERNSVNLSIRVSGITIHQEPLRIVALNDINNELDEKEIDSWMRLTRVLTHEIMNSVTPITSLSDTLLHLVDEKKENEIHQGLQTISQTGKGLLAFVESYRQFTHIPTPVPTLFFVKDFIERMVQLARHRYPDTSIAFHTSVTPDDLILHADENLIAQVMTNLLLNAMQALDQQADGHISIRAYCNEAEAILIEVTNNGPCIPPEIAEHIFVPFFTTKEGGNGIGLSISRQIMRLSGGSITLLPGKETTFILNFD